MSLPSNFLSSISQTNGFDKVAFEKLHASGEKVTSIRINPSKISAPVQGSSTPIPWTSYGYYLSIRPSFTFDPLFHAGTYYVQEASSMFLEEALKQTTDLSKSLKVLDLCAAPGGKSTHLQSLISKNSLLVSNEVIRSRANILKDNIIKWGCNNVIVTNNDPANFAKLDNHFDVIFVDAPCSGSGLFRRDPEAILEWSENNVALCSQRQQRILADVWPALKQDGVLIYSTCSYSIEEDEELLDWVSGNLPSTNLALDIHSHRGIVETVSGKGNFGYRFWPDKVKGEGFFIACFRKTDGGAETYSRVKNKPDSITKRESVFVDQWVKNHELTFIKHANTVYAWPEQHAQEFGFLLEQLKVIYSGVLVGELVRDKLVPAHSLALSTIVADRIGKLEVDHEQAIRYLQRKDLQLETSSKGWQLLTYHHHPLGWVNILQNRINNYYPKEMRILKDN